jgi:hypothetical protein
MGQTFSNLTSTKSSPKQNDAKLELYQEKSKAVIQALSEKFESIDKQLSRVGAPPGISNRAEWKYLSDQQVSAFQLVLKEHYDMEEAEEEFDEATERFITAWELLRLVTEGKDRVEGKPSKAFMKYSAPELKYRQDQLISALAIMEKAATS